MKYINAEKLIAEIERLYDIARNASYNGEIEGEMTAYDKILSIIASLQQEQPKGNLEYWLEHFGMPKENIDNCITQIAQGYGACRYLEGVRHGAEAVNEFANELLIIIPPLPEIDKELKKDWFDKYNEDVDAVIGSSCYNEQGLDEARNCGKVIVQIRKN